MPSDILTFILTNHRGCLLLSYTNVSCLVNQNKALMLLKRLTRVGSSAILTNICIQIPHDSHLSKVTICRWFTLGVAFWPPIHHYKSQPPGPDQKSSKSFVSFSEIFSAFCISSFEYSSKFAVSPSYLTLGTRGGLSFLLNTSFQSVPLNHLCVLTSSAPFLKFPILFVLSATSSFLKEAIKKRKV